MPLATPSAVLNIPSYNELQAWLASYGFAQDKIVPLILAGGLLYFFINKSLGGLKGDIGKLKNCVIELQTIIRTKDKRITLQYAVDKFGQSHSPVVLKESYKPYVVDSGLAAQIEQKAPQLIELVKRFKPETGIDAQKYIANIVSSDEIDKHIDAKSFKQLLYTKGLTIEDYYGILTVYLFEVIIPKLGIPDGKISK